MTLTAENYSKGMLVDEELMAGITSEPGDSERFTAFVLNHLTGEYLGYEVYPTLSEALSAIHAIRRDWKFEATGGCGSGQCGQGQCKIGGCGKAAATGVCAGDACSNFIS